MKHNPINITIGTLVVCILILLFVNQYNCNNRKPSYPIEVLEIDSHLKEVDSIKSLNKKLLLVIDSLNERKVQIKVIEKYLIKKIGKDTSFKEVLYLHSELDDTTVQFRDVNLIEFRLIQGLSARGELNLSRVENNVLKTIIDNQNEIIEKDSVLIVELHNDNVQYVKTIEELIEDIDTSEEDNHRLKSNNKKLLIAVGGLSAFLILIGLR